MIPEGDNGDIPVANIGELVHLRSFNAELLLVKRNQWKSSTLWTVRDLRLMGFCFKLPLLELMVLGESGNRTNLAQPEDLFHFVNLSLYGDDKLVGILNDNRKNYISIVVTDEKLFEHLKTVGNIKMKVKEIIKGNLTLTDWFQSMATTEFGQHVSQIVIKTLIKFCVVNEVMSFYSNLHKNIIQRIFSFFVALISSCLISCALGSFIFLCPLVLKEMKITIYVFIAIISNLTLAFLRLFTKETNGSFQSMFKVTIALSGFLAYVIIFDDLFFTIPTPERVFAISKKHQDKFPGRSDDIVWWVSIIVLLVNFLVENLSIIPGLLFTYKELGLLSECQEIKSDLERNFSELERLFGEHHGVANIGQIPEAQEVVNGHYDREAQVQFQPLTSDQLLRLRNCINEVAESVETRLFIQKQRLHAPITIIKLLVLVVAVGGLIWWYLKP